MVVGGVWFVVGGWRLVVGGWWPLVCGFAVGGWWLMVRSCRGLEEVGRLRPDSCEGHAQTRELSIQEWRPC